MIVSVASGKGGTGKTTVATNMAYSLGEKVQLLDCDVEEPNAHLFLKPVIEHQEQVYAMVPQVDNDKCTGCGSCAEICRFSAITLVGEAPLTFPELCHGCGGCIEVCPEEAITEGGRELGSVELGTSGHIRFGHGRLRVGEAMAPPLIKEVRNHAMPNEVVIIDAPPGTSCPVIAAMHKADFVLMVTEPTPFGLHDLKLAVEAVRLLQIPCGLVINRADLGTDLVHEYAKSEGIPVLMEIPFDRKIAEAYSTGNMLAEIDEEWKTKFTGLYRKIEMLAEC